MADILVCDEVPKPEPIKNVKKLHGSLAAALGNVFVGVDSSGVISWLPGHPTNDELKQVKTIITAHDPVDYQAAIVTDAADTLKTASPDWFAWSPEQMAEYVNTQVKDLATAKAVLVKMAFAIGALADRTFPGRRQPPPVDPSQ